MAIAQHHVDKVDNALDALAGDADVPLEDYVETLEDIYYRVETALGAARDDLKRKGV